MRFAENQYTPAGKSPMRIPWRTPELLPGKTRITEQGGSNDESPLSVDRATGTNFEHRRQWVIERLELSGEIFDQHRPLLQ